MYVTAVDNCWLAKSRIRQQEQTRSVCFVAIFVTIDAPIFVPAFEIIFTCIATKYVVALFIYLESREIEESSIGAIAVDSNITVVG